MLGTFVRITQNSRNIAREKRQEIWAYGEGYDKCIEDVLKILKEAKEELEEHGINPLYDEILGTFKEAGK